MKIALLLIGLCTLAACQATTTPDPNSTPTAVPLSATLASNQALVADAADLADTEWFALYSYGLLRFEMNGRYSLKDSSSGRASGGTYHIEETLLYLNSDLCSEAAIYQVRRGPANGSPESLLFILVEDTCTQQSTLILNGGVPWKDLSAALNPSP